MAEGDKNDKYKGLKPEIAEEIRGYETSFFREDKPIPFCGLQIYPATLHDYEAFSSCSSCLTLNKNEDPQGIRMSQLEYLISRTQLPEDEGKRWSYRIQKLLEIIFHIQNGIRCSQCGRCIPYISQEFSDFLEQVKKASQEDPEQAKLPQCPSCGCDKYDEMIKIIKDEKIKKFSLIVDGHEISKRDFDRLRNIVLFQNFPDYRDESWIDTDVKKDHDAKLELQQKMNNLSATLEKKVVCLSIATHYSFDEIFNMSIRKFTMALATVDDLINYKIMKTAAMSGFVKLEKGQTIEHWIYKENKDMYGDYKDTDSVHSV